MVILYIADGLCRMDVSDQQKVFFIRNFEYIYLFERQCSQKLEKQRERPSTCRFTPLVYTAAALGQAAVRSHRLRPVSDMDGGDPRTQTVFCSSSQCISWEARQLGHKPALLHGMLCCPQQLNPHRGISKPMVSSPSYLLYSSQQDR